MFTDIPEIPLAGLFQEIEYPEETPPFRWFNLKSTKEILGIGERSLQMYAKKGKLERKYKTVKGHRRVYYSNHSVYKLKIHLEGIRERALYKDVPEDENEED